MVKQLLAATILQMKISNSVVNIIDITMTLYFTLLMLPLMIT